jgi:hypothetical protein
MHEERMQAFSRASTYLVDLLDVFGVINYDV